MDFLKLKIGIRKYCQLFFMLMAIILTIGTSQAAGSGAVKKTSVNMDKDAKTKKLDDKSLLYKKVPVYGKDEKQKIKKYLFSLPDKITEEEAEKKGIAVQSYNFDKNNFNAVWQGFYKYAREGEKALIQKDGVIKCYAEPFKAAIVLLRYTTEGDIHYTYISFIEGEYYVVADYSRDKYMKSAPDGIDEIGTFKSLRKRREIIKYGNKNYYDVIYSVFKKPGISKKEIKRIINKKDSYIGKYYNLFDYYKSIK